MSQSSHKANVAINRFGYGLRPGEQPPADPAAFLTRQIADYDPSPAQLDGRENTSGEAGEILVAIRQQRRQRQAVIREQGMEAGEMAREDLPPELQRSFLNGRRMVMEDLTRRTRIAVQSDTPFIERMVHFWSNHFSVSAGKPGTQQQVGNHEFFAVRPNVLGKFSDMLKAASLHPAMLLYLDQFQSVGPNSPFMQRRARRGNQGGNNQGGPRGLNENLAREIMELHTLGVDGGYSQADVTELARALTGWTLGGLPQVRNRSVPQASGAVFAGLAHEQGNRRVMGKSYPAGGAEQALAILDDLAAHPSTARFIATKLARHFAGDEPPQSLVARLEASFLDTGGDLAALTRTLIASPEAWSEAPVKFRAPYEWLVSAIRMTGNTRLEMRPLVGALDQLGQVPWRAPSPAGYDDIAGSWAGPDALYRRVEVAEQIARNTPADDVVSHAQRAFPGGLSEHTRIALTRAESSQQALALLLVSPEMMRR